MMWSRSELKEKAKELLRVNYWRCFVISLVVVLLGGGAGGGSGFNFKKSWNSDAKELNELNRLNDFHGIGDNIDWGAVLGIALVFIVIFAIIMIFALLFGILVSNPIEVGGRKAYISASLDPDKNVEIGLIGFAFKNSYGNIVKTMFLKNLYIFFWSLLLVIPGIIKSYSYKMVPYILAENPGMDSNEAIRQSMDMTYGHKWSMFILDLSFLGWWILGLLALFVGTFFVYPYVDATYAQLYLTLKNEA